MNAAIQLQGSFHKTLASVVKSVRPVNSRGRDKARNGKNFPERQIVGWVGSRNSVAAPVLKKLFILLLVLSMLSRLSAFFSGTSGELGRK